MMKLPRRRATLLVCAVALAGLAGTASARPAHKAGHKHAAASVAGQKSHSSYARKLGYSSKASPQVKSRRGRRAHAGDAFGGFTANPLVSEARKYLGTNPTGRSSLWCGAFMDLVLKRTGRPGGGNLANAYARYGTRVSGPQVGAIAVISRRGGGHVGVVSGIDPNGNPIIVSGNHNRTVAESVYPSSRIKAYVLPDG